MIPTLNTIAVNYEVAKTVRRGMKNPWLAEEIDRIASTPWRAEFCIIVASYEETRRRGGYEPFRCTCGGEAHWKNTIMAFKCVDCHALTTYAERPYTDAPADPAPAASTPIESPGVFKYGADVYIVKPNRQKTRLYAKRMVESTTRLNDEGEAADVDFEYCKGAMAFLREEHRMSVEEGKALTIRYSRCICCGRRLKVKTSVERGIGPVCIKYFAQPADPEARQFTDIDQEALVS